VDLFIAGPDVGHWDWQTVRGAHFVNDVRVQFARRGVDLTPTSHGALIEVPGVVSFGQSSQLDASRTEDHVQVAESAAGYEGAIRNRSHKLGSNDSDTLDGEHSKGKMLVVNGAGSQAITILRAVADDRARIQGDSHSDTLETLKYLHLARLLAEPRAIGFARPAQAPPAPEQAPVVAASSAPPADSSGARTPRWRPVQLHGSRCAHDEKPDECWIRAGLQRTDCRRSGKSAHCGTCALQPSQR